MNKYYYKTVLECPVGGASISYEILLTSHNTIYVEHLIDTVEGVITPMLQEEFADLLKVNFKQADVYVVAYHSGVKVETWR